ncbi:hypothetical protein EDD21DRAFT_419560 [Dissophora ornata]|nr:hypothetical protein BGZ58_009999 [Dissophora ornata]KAI8596553.1 hypothetical protein EDD21DRAFT_419560 [Dissophora ornata]
MDPLALPSRQSAITLQDITARNWESITRLVVNRDQLSLVVPNIQSLCEHQFHAPHSLVRAIVADTTAPVGYIRLQQDPEEPGQGVFQLLSFMIDQACQGLGFGTEAMLLLQKEMVNVPGFKGIRVPTKAFAGVHPDDSPEHFFAGLGFEKSKDPQVQELTWSPNP